MPLNVLNIFVSALKVNFLLSSIIYLIHHVPSSDHTAVATCAKFGRNAEFLASAGMDRNLRYFARR